jgi:hypothetical protein
MATDPPPSWPIEPTILFIWQYYPTNEINATPAHTSNMIVSYNDAVNEAKAYILSQGNTGVVIISQISGVIVYPSIPWEDF